MSKKNNSVSNGIIKEDGKYYILCGDKKIEFNYKKLKKEQK